MDMSGNGADVDKYRLLHDLHDAAAEYAKPQNEAPDDRELLDADAVDDFKEHAYGVKLGTEFGNQYSPETWAKAYPDLFPFGVGMPGSIPNVSLLSYFRRAMALVDDRFRSHKFFLFEVFSVQQKREVSMSARLAMHRKNWTSVKHGMSRITADDIGAALKEEEAGSPITNPTLREFFRTVKISRSHVLGSDGERYFRRQQVWGLCISFGNPAIFLTLNPVDHHDPVAIVLAGEDIDLDHFTPTSGPNASERTRLLVKNPFASTEYFHLVLAAVLEHLLGIKITHKNVVSQPGVLGVITAYLVAVEAQLRSNLHAHVILWLANTPDCAVLQQMYQDEDFLANLNAYIRRTISAHVVGLNEQRGLGPAPAPHPSWNRPVDADHPDFNDLALKAERVHVETSQFHKCIPYPFGCGRVSKTGKKLKCKRGSASFRSSALERTLGWKGWA